MRSREYYWSLYHTAESNQLDNLRTDQVEAVYASVPKRNLSEWMIWRDGFETWKRFEDFPQLLLSLRKVDQSAQEAPPPPPKPKAKSAAPVGAKSTGAADSAASAGASMPGATEPAREQSQPGFEYDDGELELSFETPGSTEERNNFRFEKNFDIRIIVGTQVHTNKTVNISLKGMQLQAPLPAGLPRYFNVEIRHREKSMQVVCSTVRNSDSSPPDRLKIEVNDFTPALLAMLLDS